MILDQDFAEDVLLALAGGDLDRAATLCEERVEDSGDLHPATLIRQAATSADAARVFGDWLRSLQGPNSVTNEAYRIAFYRGPWWKEQAQSPLGRYFFGNRAGRPLDKWPHYFPIYERFLSRWVGTDARVLEIGVFRGGGLDLLSDYLGAQVQLVGMDIDAHAADLADERFPVFIGDQSNPDHLRALNDQYGPFDVIIDDGGHTIHQQVTSAETLFPLLNDGGVYLIEDVHTSYWDQYLDDGERNLLDWVRDRLDDLNAYHHSREIDLTEWQSTLRAVHAYDSVVVLEKGRSFPPFSEVVGTKEFVMVNRERASLDMALTASRDAAIRQRDRAHRLLSEAQTLAVNAMQQVERAQQDTAQARAELERMSRDLELAQARMDQLHNSRSWRITAPLRRITDKDDDSG